MRRGGHLRAVWRHPGFRTLLAVRLTGQFGDGIFQASLAGAVLFDPQRQAHAADIAQAFTVLLLPYSLIGPFAGVLIDRWSRQAVLVLANLLRALVVIAVAAEISASWTGVGFSATALVVISVSRFVLAALSAATPHVVRPADLVTANALATTAGTMATVAGAGFAIALRTLVGTTHTGYAVIAIASIPAFLTAGLIGRRFARSELGPTNAERRERETVADVVRGFAAGARAVRAQQPVARALLAITAHRLCFGVWTVCVLLLYRNYFTGDGPFPSGLAGLAQILVAGGVGGGLAALVTPVAYRRLGPTLWPTWMLLTSAAVQLALGLPYQRGLLVLASLLLGFAGQSIKISIDTVVQRGISDRYRGRVFSLYDMLFNVTLVLAAALTAAVLPEDGHSPATVAAISATWALTAIAYLMSSRRTTWSAR